VDRARGLGQGRAADAIGKSLVFPPWFADRQAEMEAGLEPATF
jgi:glyoxalase family protein